MINIIDRHIINKCRRIFPFAARTSLFIIYFWFGLLKVLGTSPANPLVDSLLKSTMPFLTFQSFIFFFGILEMVIGICFLIPNFNRIAGLLFLGHMATTFMPLVMLPVLTWQSPFVPTLEGQYIIKNVALMATAVGLASIMKPLEKK
jgi:uncharacterized membrane protein YkgB